MIAALAVRPIEHEIDGVPIVRASLGARNDACAALRREAALHAIEQRGAILGVERLREAEPGGLEAGSVRRPRGVDAKGDGSLVARARLHRRGERQRISLLGVDAQWPR